MIKKYIQYIKEAKELKYTYYKIYVNKSMVNFDAALVKIGIYDDFYDEWEHDTPHHIDMIYKNNIIYLEITSNDIEAFSFNLNRSIIFDDFIFGGEITITNKDLENLDLKLKADKYNI